MRAARLPPWLEWQGRADSPFTAGGAAALKKFARIPEEAKSSWEQGRCWSQLPLCKFDLGIINQQVRSGLCGLDRVDS